jgi:hypothetical protein
VCGRVERVDVPELSLEGLCAAVSARFDIGDRLRFITDEEGEPEVSSDEHLRQLARQKQTLRVLIGDSALSDLEQRMWQLRQLQWGFFQDELARVKNSQQGLRNEMRQLRTALEQSARREVELTGELMNERRHREKMDQASLERHEALCAELRREMRARDATEAALRKDLEDARQAALKFAANAERQNTEVKAALQEEARNRGKNIEALLAEWAGNQAEVRQAMEGVRNDIDRGGEDAERQAKGLVREASAREAFEQFFGEKIRNVELILGKLEGVHTDFDRRIVAATKEAQDAMKLASRENVSSLALTAATLPTQPLLHSSNLTSSTTTISRHPSPTTLHRSTTTSPGPLQRSITPPPGVGAMTGPPLVASPLPGTQILRRSNGSTTIIRK